MTTDLSSGQFPANQAQLPIRKIFESLPGLYLVLSTDFVIEAVSNAYLQETLTEREKIIGKCIFDVFPDNPQVPEAKGTTNLRSSFKQVLSSRQPHTMAMQHYDVPNPEKEGAFVERYWSSRNTPVLDEQGEVVYIIHEVVNETEKCKAQRQLEESRAREQAALEKAEHQRARLERFLMQAPAIIAIHDGSEFIFEFTNPLYEQVFPGRKLLGKPLFEGLPELAGTPVEEIIRQVYKTGETYEGREVLIPLAANEGSPLSDRYYDFIYQARYDETGKVDGIMVFAFDVSAQVEARKVLEENAGHLRFMANAMPQKVWTAKANGDVDYYNEKWLKYTGLSARELEGWGWKKVIHPDDLEENEKLWKQSLATGNDYQLEHRFKRKDGQYRWHLSRSIAQRNEDGSIRMWVGTSTDIHDQKMAEQSLQELTSELKEKNTQLTHINVDLDNFIYTASHDLKAPLTNIEGLMQLLLKRLPKEFHEQKQIQPLLGMIQTSVERFKKTITSLTDITKLQKDANQEPSRLIIEEIVQNVALDLHPLIEEAGAEITLDTEECAEISFSEKNLRSILYNLISNAVKYRSPERTPKVHISCRTVPGFAVLNVQDNGLGIDLNHEKKLFTMFKRLHKHVEGSGIGLFMVKRIVENAGGKIEVQSRLNEGSTFSVYFRL